MWGRSQWSKAANLDSCPCVIAAPKGGAKLLIDANLSRGPNLLYGTKLRGADL